MNEISVLLVVVLVVGPHLFHVCRGDMTERIAAGSVFRDIDNTHLLVYLIHLFSDVGGIVVVVVPAIVSVLGEEITFEMDISVALVETTVGNAYKSVWIKLLRVVVEFCRLIDNALAVDFPLQFVGVSPAVELVPHAPENDGRMVVERCDHLAHLLMNVVEVGRLRIHSAYVDPWYFCLNDDTQRIAECVFDVAMRIMSQS